MSNYTNNDNYNTNPLAGTNKKTLDFITELHDYFQLTARRELFIILYIDKFRWGD